MQRLGYRPGGNLFDRFRRNIPRLLANVWRLLGPAQPPQFGQHFIEAQALDELHDLIMQSVLFADAVDRRRPFSGISLILRPSAGSQDFTLILLSMATIKSRLYRDRLLSLSAPHREEYAA